MNIYPPSFHGLPSKVYFKWSKSPPWMALIFMSILDHLLISEKEKNPGQHLSAQYKQQDGAAEGSKSSLIFRA